MSLDTVVEDIRDEARARAEEIRAEAETEAEALLAEAEADAEEIREEREQEVERTIKQEREQRISSANLQAKQERLKARRNVLNEVRERVEDRLADMEGDKRKALTEELLEDALSEFDESRTVMVYGRADDKELLESVADAYDRVEYGDEYDCLGGVVVESEAARVRVNNTFDSVLESVWEDTLRDISTQLFDEQ